jgi:hypothetical protein
VSLLLKNRSFSRRAHLPPDVYRARVAALVEKVESDATLVRNLKGLPVLDVKAVLTKDPQHRPASLASAAPGGRSITVEFSLLWGPRITIGLPFLFQTLSPVIANRPMKLLIVATITSFLVLLVQFFLNGFILTRWSR